MSYTPDPPPQVWFDFEFVFLHGAPPVAITIEEGRWLAKEHEDGTRVFQFSYADGAIEEVVVQPGALAYLRMVKRQEPPPSHTEDGGRTRVVGVVN